MEDYYLSQDRMMQYKEHLVRAERSNVTIEKYMRDIGMLYRYLPKEKTLSKTAMMEFKKHLLGTYSTRSVNSVLAALNGFLNYMGWQPLRVSQLKTQAQIFCKESKELTRVEYVRLLNVAKAKKNERLCLIMQTICATGIRVSELSSITVQSLKEGSAQVRCKNKNRMIFIPGKLRKKLLVYIKRRKIKSGSIFQTRSGRPVHRCNIWTDMKKLCAEAAVCAEKVYPHNLRHLFARTYYNLEKDIVKLADLLGHSSIETTRIYTVSSGREHEKRINALRLVI